MVKLLLVGLTMKQQLSCGSRCDLYNNKITCCKIFAPKYILQTMFGIMSLLTCLLRQWTSCPPQVRDHINRCVFSLALPLQPTPHKYRVKACGSGKLLGYFTKLELQKWLKTHRLFLGHGGSQITDPKQFLSTYQGPIVAVNNVFRGELFKMLERHTYWVKCVAWSPDGSTLASGSCDKTIKLWSNDGDEFSVQTLKEHNATVSCVAWSPDGQTLASGSYQTIKLWNSTGECIQTLTGHTDWVNCVAWHPDGQTLASGSYSNTIKLWSKDGECIKILRGHTDWVRSVAWSPDGSTLASGSYNNTIKLWSKDGECIRTLEGHTKCVTCVAWHPDGQTLASGSSDKTIKLWSQDGIYIKTLEGHAKCVNCVVWNPQGFALTSASSDGIIKLWSKDGKLVQTLEGHTCPVRSVAWSPNGQTLACGFDDKTTIELWK